MPTQNPLKANKSQINDNVPFKFTFTSNPTINAYHPKRRKKSRQNLQVWKKTKKNCYRCFHFRFLTPKNATYSEFKFMPRIIAIVLCIFSFSLFFVFPFPQILLRFGHSRKSPSYTRFSFTLKGIFSLFTLSMCMNVCNVLCSNERVFCFQAFLISHRNGNSW